MTALTSRPAVDLRPGDTLHTSGAVVQGVSTDGKLARVALRTTSGARVAPVWPAAHQVLVWRAVETA